MYGCVWEEQKVLEAETDKLEVLENTWWKYLAMINWGSERKVIVLRIDDAWYYTYGYYS